jgi:hypothetical protein
MRKGRKGSEYKEINKIEIFRLDRSGNPSTAPNQDKFEGSHIVVSSTVSFRKSSTKVKGYVKFNQMYHTPSFGNVE